MTCGDWVVAGIQAFAALVTLCLIIAAFRTIRQTRELRAEDKKDRIISDVSDWACDVTTIPFEEGYVDPRFIVDLLEKEQIIVDKAKRSINVKRREVEKNRCLKLLIKGALLADVTKNFNQDLSIAIDNTRKNLESIITVLESEITLLAEEIDMEPNKHLWDDVITNANKVLQIIAPLVATTPGVKATAFPIYPESSNTTTNP